MYFYESNAATVLISIRTRILYFFFKISMNQFLSLYSIRSEIKIYLVFSRVPPTAPLRVAAAGPNLATLADDARAGHRRVALGCQISLYSSRSRCRGRVCREIAPVATWSRSPSSIGRARRDCVFFLLAVLLWWQEVWHGRGLETGISNKVVLPFSRRICVMVRHHSVGRPQVNLFVEPAWWWRDDDGRSSGSFFNKRPGDTSQTYL
jgi:hypothetical protein